jgi:hypothetical protein
MNTTERPVNKQAALFLTRKNRLETIGEALDKFASKLCSPEVAQNVKEMIARNRLGDDVQIAITLKIRRDPRTPDQFAVSMDTKMASELGTEGYYGLR